MVDRMYFFDVSRLTGLFIRKIFQWILWTTTRSNRISEQGKDITATYGTNTFIAHYHEYRAIQHRIYQ